MFFICLEKWRLPFWLIAFFLIFIRLTVLQRYIVRLGRYGKKNMSFTRFITGVCGRSYYAWLTILTASSFCEPENAVTELKLIKSRSDRNLPAGHRSSFAPSKVSGYPISSSDFFSFHFHFCIINVNMFPAYEILNYNLKIVEIIFKQNMYLNVIYAAP